ncbi:phosphotransferase family protein [Lolliginicoccus suaedae]|uniref:phosphotransferase family protein n=1 Tax=Lolliginicoccus suaedae TaxID=2605429 RepID=UPI0011EC2E96|nr:phosphotransferase family protein [Lolliginicoccus suaedae]
MSGGDATIAPREDDAFDVARLHAWLAEHIEGLGSLPAVRQFPGGASNLTYLLEYPGRELVLRRPPGGHRAASAHDMQREFRVQQAIAPVFPHVPEMLALCTDESVIGSEFYVMERLSGVILRRDLPEGAELTPDGARKACTQMLDRLVELHGIDIDAAGLRDLGKGTGYVARQVSGWSDRYRRARTDNVPDFEAVMRWLAGNQPPDVATCLIHNDFRFDNVVFDSLDTLRVIGILDWEMATLGDPLMELGASLAYWVQADDDEVMQQTRRQPTHLPGMMTRDEVVQHYCARTGITLDDWTFYEVYGLFRLAGIVQQLYKRYHDGGTTNPVFAKFWMFVGYLEWRCRSRIGLG